MSEINRNEVIESELDKRLFIVEIGPAGLYGSGTAVKNWSQKVERDLRAGALYLAVDTSKANLDKHQECEIYDAVVGDMAKMPLQDGSVDQIWIMNVFSDLEFRPEIKPDGTHSYTFNRDKFFRELSRVIKEKGEIVIGELGFPMGGIGAVDYLREIDYTAFGLKAEIFFEDNFEEGCSRYGFSKNLKSIIEENPLTKGVSPFIISLKKYENIN